MSTLLHGVTLIDIPEVSVRSIPNIREILGEGGVDLGEDQMEVMQVIAMRDHGEIFGSSHRPDLSGFGDTTDAIDIRLQDVRCLLIDDLLEVPPGIGVLAMGDLRLRERAEPAIAIDIMGHQRLFDPLQTIGT